MPSSCQGANGLTAVVGNVHKRVLVPMQRAGAAAYVMMGGDGVCVYGWRWIMMHAQGKRRLNSVQRIGEIVLSCVSISVRSQVRALSRADKPRWGKWKRCECAWGRGSRDIDNRVPMAV